MKEWRKDDAFNSFNNWKGLLYRKQMEAIADHKTLKPPIEARIDPTLKCNLNCAHCNSAAYRGHKDELDAPFIDDLIDHLAHWGVKGLCIAGGGEPTLHPYFTEMVRRAYARKISVGLLSNGTSLIRGVHETVGALTRWAGISVDAGTAATYKVLKGVDLFQRVLDNLSVMAKTAISCNVGYKFLISPLNQYELVTACKIAKDIGVRDFIARPMDTLHQGMANHDIKLEDFDAASIYKQFEECHAMATDDFHVFTIMHKFNPDFSHSKPFKQCYGAALKVHIAPDRKVYFCDDQFYRPEYCIGECVHGAYDLINIWGNEKHKQLLYGDTPSKCKTRCCISDYNIQCERLFVNQDDPMCKDFP